MPKCQLEKDSRYQSFLNYFISMGRAIFNRYWKEKYSDAPDGQPHDDNNVPYEHLTEYIGRPAAIHLDGSGLGLSMEGTFTASETAFGVTNSAMINLYIASNTVSSIKWVESEKYYQIVCDKFSLILKPG